MESPRGNVEETSRQQEVTDGALDLDPVQTCDGHYMDALEARNVSRKYYMMGFFGLPLFWAVNVWLFGRSRWTSVGFEGEPHQEIRDPVVSRCAYVL